MFKLLTRDLSKNKDLESKELKIKIRILKISNRKIDLKTKTIITFNHNH